ncbi:MAG: hypothetical protein Q7W16_07005 [Coriobacteriia bacterium]|nr:hypothetical protein [Coriobacteriia bacterium]
MGTARYALERGAEKSLEISFDGPIWKNTQIRLDGELVGSFPDKKAFAAGAAFPLPDGSVLHAQFAHRMPVLLRDGVPVPGSATDPVQTLRTACGILYAIAGSNVALGLIAWGFEWEYLRTMSYGPVSIAVGLVLFVLGLLAQRRSVVALIAAIGVASLHMAFVVLCGFVAGVMVTEDTFLLRWAALMLEYMSVPLGFLGGGIFALIPLGRAVGAIRQLKKG